MSTAVEMIRDLIGNSGPDLRRGVQVAVARSVQHGLEREVLREIESSNDVASRWLRAALTEKVSGPEVAVRAWEQVVDQNGCEIPDVLLQRARSIARSGDVRQAANLMRTALQNSQQYDFFVRAEAIARKCKTGFECRRRIKIALLSSSTTGLLRSVLELLFLRDGLEAEFYEPAFGTYVQELLLPDSGLKRFQANFVLLLLSWRDLGLSTIAADESECNRAISWVKDLWRAALDSLPGKIIQLTFTPPAFDPGHSLSSLMRYGRSRTIRKINEALYEAALDRAILIDSERIGAAWKGVWEDPLMWSSAKIYPAPAVLPAVGEQIASCIRAEMGLSRKLLVLDLDNTLWGGVIGEDGLNGIRLGPPSALGERYQEFQRYLKDLKERGVLLALASKNNPQDAMDALRRHPSAVLRCEDFVSLKINWEDKATNIRRIASELRLGLDSFVFLDDNPAERSAVRRELPEVLVPEISGEPAESIAALERGLYFQALRLTEEDRVRNASYFANSKQAEISSIGSMDDYLSELSMHIEYGPVDAETIIRVTQLINKTNQFNLTTKRYTEEQVQSRMTSPAYWCRWYRLKDRFADHGLIGVLMAETGVGVWKVDTWLMSCRVIGREVESFMFRDLVLNARSAGAKQIAARYIPTAKNDLVAQLLPRFGFSAGAGIDSFVLDLSAARLPECKFMQEVQRSMETPSGGSGR
jgi:FkbH-like protein